MKFSLLLCTLFVYSFFNAYADPGGKAGRLLTNSGGCGDCHGGSPSSLTAITITSKSGSFTVKPGTKLEMTAAVAHPSKSAAGINIGVKTAPNANTNIGTLDVVAGQGLKKSSAELVQSAPKNMTNGKSEFTFTWTAPTQEGVYYLMATGNAVNKNGGDSGDEWNFMQPIQLTVTSTTDIQEQSISTSTRLYPNPLLENSILEYELSETSSVTYSIVNTLGTQLMYQNIGMQEQGKHSLGLWGIYSMLTPGHFVITIQTRQTRMAIPFIKQ